MDLGKELLKLEGLLKDSGLLMEKYKKKITNLQREKTDLKENYDQLKSETGSYKDRETSHQKQVTEISREPISQLQVKQFQKTIQNILAEQRNFEKELENMRLSKQFYANEAVALQNSLSRLKHDFKTRSYADRDMQILKREVQRVWSQKRLSDEERQKKEAELAKSETMLKNMEVILKHTTTKLNKANTTLRVYKIILKEQRQQIQNLCEEVQKQSSIIEKQSQHLENCLNELESSKSDQKQVLLNLEFKMKEENHLKNLLSQKRQENMNLKMELFLLQEKLSESQHQQEMAVTKLKWNEKYWNYYQSRLEAQDKELRNTSQEYLWINDQGLSFGSRTDFVIHTMNREIREVLPKCDGPLIKSLVENPPSLMLEPSLDNLLSPQNDFTYCQHKAEIAALEMELEKKTALLDFQEKYKQELECHIKLLHEIFLGKLGKR